MSRNQFVPQKDLFEKIDFGEGIIQKEENVVNIKYKSNNGKNILELWQNAIDKFHNQRVYDYISRIL